VDIAPLGVPGSFLVTTTPFLDDRGEFVEWFRADSLTQQTGLSLQPVQANLSVSRQWTLRGIHYVDVPPGQAKYVMCATGSIRDYVVDIRLGSPTFGQWEAVTLSAGERNALVLDVGLGHAFVALEEGTTVTYLVSDVYKPHAEHAVNPLDPALGLEFPTAVATLLISPKDHAAPTLEGAQQAGKLPMWQGG